MVMDRIPSSLNDLMNADNDVNGRPLYPKKKFAMSLNMAISVIAKLKVMHNLNVNLGDNLSTSGILHGDVHPGNIAQLIKGDLKNFGLIDFGKALLSSEIRAHTDMGTWEPNCYLSHYNMKGAGFSYRDDVYKTLLAASFLMTGTVVFKKCMSLARKSQDAIVNFHSQTFLFDPDETGIFLQQALPNGSAEDRRSISEHLREALRLSRAVEDVKEQPPYDAIIRELDSALQIFKTR
jgi:hypothetical protein